jgi:hypothetical protein
MMREKQLRSFGQGFDALSAQRLTHLAPIDKQRNTLQVGLKSAIGGAHREGTPVAKGRRFTTVFTLCHGCQSFPHPEVISNGEFYHTPHRISTYSVKLIKRKGGQK